MRFFLAINLTLFCLASTSFAQFQNRAIQIQIQESIPKESVQQLAAQATAFLNEKSNTHYVTTLRITTGKSREVDMNTIELNASARLLDIEKIHVNYVENLRQYEINKQPITWAIKPFSFTCRSNVTTAECLKTTQLFKTLVEQKRIFPSNDVWVTRYPKKTNSAIREITPKMSADEMIAEISK